MSASKWRLSRAGLLNFWYYDEEEFHFADGKLLLRGLNGSGKSVTMQSLITVLLDGKIAAARLDPFGSRDRRMEDYLLGEKEIVDREERTGYLYLEYRRADSERFLTTGIGLKARRGAQLEFWGFVITDNRRVGHELKLLKTEYSAVDGAEEKIPLTRSELERMIGPGGVVVRTQQEYMALVNKHMFGFASIDDYKDLMELLIQLRSPKLSKDFKPSVIHEILTESLPTLSDEELRPLADTIENIEATKQQLEQLERDRSAVQRLSRQYDAYNRFVLAQKMDEAAKAEQRKTRAEQMLAKQTREREREEASRTALLLEIAELERRQQALASEEVALREHDVFKAEKERQAAEQELARLLAALAAKQQDLAAKQKVERREKDQLTQEQRSMEEGGAAMQSAFEDITALVPLCAYENHESYVRGLERSDPNFSFKAWKGDVAVYQRRLDEIAVKLREHTLAKAAQETAQREVDDARLAFDMKESELRKAQVKLADGKEELLEQAQQWIVEQKDVLPLTAEEIRTATRAIRDLFEETTWPAVIRPVDAALRRQQEIQMHLDRELSHRIDLVNKDREERRGQLTLWQKKREPEPARHIDADAARLKLTERGIPHLSLYAAVEFRSGLTDALQERIEAALADIGLLDALIVPAAQLNLLEGDEFDRIIRPQPEILAATLADYLCPAPPEDSGVAASDIDEVLRSIIIDDAPALAGGGTTLSVSSGSYRSGVLSGCAPLSESAVYIGREARKRFRQQEMERLQAEIDRLSEQIKTLSDERQQVSETMAELTDRYSAFPSPAAVTEQYGRVQTLRFECIARREDMDRKDGRHRAAIETVKKILSTVQNLAAGISLPLNETAYLAAQVKLHEYRTILLELESACQRREMAAAASRRTLLRLEEARHDVDTLKGECYVLEDSEIKTRLLISSINERLAALGAEDIKKRSAQIIEQLSVLPELLKSKNRAEAAAKEHADNLGIQIEKLKLDATFQSELALCWQQALQQERGLQLVEEAGWDDAEMAKQAAGLIKSDERETATKRLSDSFYRENAVLVEYRLVMEDVEGDILPPAMPAAEEPETYLLQLERFRQILRRQRVTLEYDGRRVGPSSALKMMDQQIQTQQIIQSQQDRELYEEVILNSIGRIISKRIQNAEQWAAQMNELMSGLDTSSGLTFSLRWRSLSAEKDDQLDTTELVELLRSDHRLLKEEDLQRIVQHFRSRIEQAKASVTGKAVTFQQAVQDVLDFRRWFAFTLYYRRQGMDKKELTNSIFGKFSGGEKAMAMYVPLFSAAYSRYKEAKPDAPYIISLDEAFAGVDENNIREMFDLVEKLDFNYIMNSQVLWGDYDTVSKLAIYELVRPKDAPYVTLVPYLWDGKVRNLLAKEVS